MSTDLSQEEADALRAMEKRREDTAQRYAYPVGGGRVTVPLISLDERERFILDVSQRRIQLNRNRFQVRARTVIVLARLDLDDLPHRNPDGEVITGPHLHLYREGFGDKWASSLPDQFTDPKDCMLTLSQFLEFCVVRDAVFEDGGLLG